MNYKNSIETAVGLFVLMAVGAFLFLALKVSGLQEVGQDLYPFSLKAQFNNIGGLKIRARVTIDGVTIGRVRDIRLSRAASGSYAAIVELGLLPDVGAYLSEDTSARILTAGLIGDNFLALTPGGSDSLLRSGDVLTETQSALLLEDLINKYLANQGNQAKS
jgi:phospholipid/cholesterol/gamma-HCH transport system substrate-binding protein